MISTQQGKNILIVDDTPENLTVLRQILAEHGFWVRPAISGEIALRTVKAGLPDLILLDIVMPGMDGYEVCRRLKSEKKTREIPIIFISALSEIENKMRAFSEGGVDYISKPFHAQEVLARVKTQLALYDLVKTLEKKNSQLESALNEVKQLQGMLPICAKCKNIRDDSGYWTQIEAYLQKHANMEFSHGMCPDCMDEVYGSEDWYIKMKNAQKEE